MKAKRIIAIVSLLIILAAGVWAMINAASLPKTYDGKEIGDNVDTFYSEAADYDGVFEEADAAQAEAEATIEIADDIVANNLEGTMAANNVAAVVFDFRGFDTLGESFILLTSIAGAFVILSMSHKKKEDKE